MAYIKAQKIIRDKNGVIISGSASIIESEYVPDTPYHSKKHVREKLGKVLYLSEDKKSGIFLSPVRGLVRYDAQTDSFSPVDHADPCLKSNPQFPEPQIHTVFGDVYLLLEFMEKTGLLTLFRDVFTEKKLFEKVLIHILHDVLALGSHIGCDDFMASSFASYLFEDLPISSLRSDPGYYEKMGDDSLRVNFFRCFVKIMKQETMADLGSSPEFGKGCYVDSTPLPNEIRNLMSNAYCSHGTAGSCMQTRMYLVLDDKTDLPVWYGLTPGNVLDLNTINTIISDTFVSVGVEIDSMVLDAGYITKDFLIRYRQEDEKSFIGKSPRKRGFQFKTRYNEVKHLIPNAKYEIFRNGKAYFAYKKSTELFGIRLWSYIYVDQKNALDWHTDYVQNHYEEYQKMSDKDKNWHRIKNGFFILLSNKDEGCADILDQYIERVDIEHMFKSAKGFGNLLPLSRWTKTKVDGKIFSEMIVTIVILLLRKKLIPNRYSLPDFAGKPRSLMCFKDQNDNVIIECPNKQVKEIYRVFDVKIPSSLHLSEYKKKIYGTIGE